MHIKGVRLERIYQFYCYVWPIASPAKLARVHNDHRMLPLLISRKSDFNYLISVIIVEGMRLFIQERRREYLTEIITNRGGPIYPPIQLIITKNQYV